MKHKKLFIAFTAVFTVLLALVIFIMIWIWGDSYKSNERFDGFEDYRKEIQIPGLKDGACPQGIGNYRAKYTVKDENGNPVTDANGKETTATQDYFFISAYFDKQPSRIYVVGNTTGLVGYVTLKNTDGSYNNEHCGGVATNGYTLWVASGKKVLVASKKNSTSTDNIAYDIIKAAEENGELQFTSEFHANLNAAFCFFYDADGDPANRSYNDRFYVGEFYRSGNYETDKKHHLTTPNGNENKAFMYEYNISTSENDYGLTTLTADNLSGKNVVPRIQAIYSITDQIQGVARTKDTSDSSNGNTWKGGVVLSQSYGLANSHILYYDWAKITKTDSGNRTSYKDLTYKNEKGDDVKYARFEYEGITTNSGAPYYYTNSDLYVYYVDDSKILNNYSIPSMSEGMCVINDRVYVLFESGANKYKTFVREVLNHVYSFIPRNKK